MNELLDWRGMKQMYERLLIKRTGKDVEIWNQRIANEAIPDEPRLRAWLNEQGVTGYPQALLVMERFGYPDFMTASADELINGQYKDRPGLRPILDALLLTAAGLGSVTVQARKTYISLVTPRRTFARVQPTTRYRLDLLLRLAGVQPEGRLKTSKVDEHYPVQIGLASPEDIDDDVLNWLNQAYEMNK
jgi:hypothetical protein